MQQFLNTQLTKQAYSLQQSAGTTLISYNNRNVILSIMYIRSNIHHKRFIPCIMACHFLTIDPKRSGIIYTSKFNHCLPFGYHLRRKFNLGTINSRSFFPLQHPCGRPFRLLQSGYLQCSKIGDSALIKHDGFPAFIVRQQ